MRSTRERVAVQRADPVVVPEGLSAGGGVCSTAVDPAVPLGPALLATCPMFHGPHARMASARMNAAATMASVLPLVELFRSRLSCMRHSCQMTRERRCRRNGSRFHAVVASRVLGHRVKCQ